MQDNLIKVKKDRSLVCALVLGLLPLVYVLVKLIINRTPVSLLTCEWNDELFYFKQVESIIDYGYPLGYYGFNESHALSLSFAAWSPVLVWPWVLLGKIFGWTMKSVFVYNTVIYMVALFLFGIMVKPTVKQTVLISVWFFSFFLNLRYLYSCMPEVICFAHLLVFWGCMLAYFRVRSLQYASEGDAAKVTGGSDAAEGADHGSAGSSGSGKVHKGTGYIIAAVLLGMIMTFMRPYLILFLVFPLMVMFFSVKGAAKKLIVAGASCVIMGITAFIYYLLNHYLSAEYLMPFFYTDFITTFFTDGFGAGVHNLLGTLYYKGRDFIQFMMDAFYVHRAAGIFFDIYVLMMILQAVQCVQELMTFRRSKKSAGTEAGSPDAVLSGVFWCRLYMLFADFAFLMAILLMYNLTEGSKHLLTFIVVGVILMIVREEKS
ncbi:MAG: hypothetical protein ILP17_10445, partial [Lachnospiraceae bacterium]|nr:hypothetical protein [Lachnospiraceae bacterium]